MHAPRRDLWGDADLLTTVLLNLVNNACESSPVGSPIDVEAETTQERLRVRVRDRGQGLSQQARERLFHPFFTTKPQGNGLGLAVSRNIVQEHGGEIRASSSAEGTTFEVDLPRKESRDAATHPHR